MVKIALDMLLAENHFVYNKFHVEVGAFIVEDLAQLHQILQIPQIPQILHVYQTNILIMEKKYALMNKVGANHQHLHGCTIHVINVLNVQPLDLAQEINNVPKVLIATI